MEDTACTRCGFSPLPDGARFCQQCGYRLPNLIEPSSQPKTGNPTVLSTVLWPVGTIVFSLGLSWFLMTVLHWPVFILGAFLPLVWKFSKKP
jgi:hypothetical protein